MCDHLVCRTLRTTGDEEGSVQHLDGCVEQVDERFLDFS